MEDFDVYEDPNNKDENMQTQGDTNESIQENLDTETIQTKTDEKESSNFDCEVNIDKESQGQQKEKEQKIRKKNITGISSNSFVKRHKGAVVVSACILLSASAGFGGSLLAMNLSNGNKAVLYQGVDNKNTTTNTKTASGTAMSVKDVANKTMESVVEIKTESVSTNNVFQQAIQSGAGSGVILSKDGYIVTNNHVISGANIISVTTKDGKSHEAKLIGTDPTTDLAIIKVEANNLTPAVLGESSKLAVGDTAIAIGNPLGELGGTVTSGIISALDREVTIDNQSMHLLQTNAAINPGNSGGGLFNDQGQLIGIVNAKSSGSNIEGLGFAIPIDRAKEVISDLIENGQVKGRASLGVSLQEENSSNPFSQENQNQVYIVQIVDGKAASKAGLKAGDQILKVDDKDVSSISDVKTAINAHKAGDKIKITVLRNNEIKTFTAKLDEASSSTTNNKSNKDTQEKNQNPFSNK